MTTHTLLCGTKWAFYGGQLQNGEATEARAMEGQRLLFAGGFLS
jgi:hypothetical protein